MFNKHTPIFCFASYCDDGGSEKYTGLGYVIEKNINSDEYWNNHNKIFSWNIRPWFIM